MKIAKDVITGAQLLQSYYKALSKTLKDAFVKKIYHEVGPIIAPNGLGQRFELIFKRLDRGKKSF